MKRKKGTPLVRERRLHKQLTKRLQIAGLSLYATNKILDMIDEQLLAMNSKGPKTLGEAVDAQYSLHISNLEHAFLCPEDEQPVLPKQANLILEIKLARFLEGA